MENHPTLITAAQQTHRSTRNVVKLCMPLGHGWSFIMRLPSFLALQQQTPGPMGNCLMLMTAVNGALQLLTQVNGAQQLFTQVNGGPTAPHTSQWG